MPKYKLDEGETEPVLTPTLELNGGGEIDLRLTNQHGDSNIIQTLTAGGSVRLHVLGCSWAEKSGIQTDECGRIAIA